MPGKQTAAVAYTVDGLVIAFNKVVVAGFNKKLKKLSSGLMKSIVKKYNVTPSEVANYPFSKFAEGLEEKLGARKYQTLSEAYNMTIMNIEYDKGIVLERTKFERAQAAASLNPLAGLNIQLDQINSFQVRAVDHPIEKAMAFLEAGDTNTYGVCFDGQNLFDTTHSYGNVAGSQSNILTGGGTTLTLIHEDVLTAIGLLQGFTWTSDDNHSRLLNPQVTKIDIICAPLLYPKFLKLKQENNISVSEGNMVKGFINDILVYPFSDGDDYYVIDVSDSEDDLRPVLFQEEKKLEFNTPNLKSESYIEEGLLKYGANYRGGVGYGAWWRAIQVTNT